MNKSRLDTPAILLSARERKRELIREVATAWVQKSPGHARELADYLTELTKVDLERSEVDGYGLCRVRAPQELFFVLRYCWRRFFAEADSDFGDDDDDMRLLADEFPRIVTHRDKRSG